MEPHDPVDPELDALLRDARPRPAMDWTRATEQRLLPHRRARPAFLGPLRIGAAVAGGLAALTLTLSLAGEGPLSGDDAVQARDCRTVAVTKIERMPQLTVDENGTPRITYSSKPVRRFERRCR